MSWALEAIEREALTRAQRRLDEIPNVCVLMGVSQDRLIWLIHDYEHRTGQPASLLDPKAPLA